MPTKEPIADTIIPQTEAKPIPTRVISTKPSKSQAEVKPPVEKKPTNQDQPNKVEAKPGAETKPPTTEEKTVTLSSQLSAVARKEQAFRQREKVLADREKALEAKLASADKFDQLQTKLKSKDFSELESLGVTYEDIVKYELEKPASTDPNAVALTEIKSELASMKREQEEKADREFEETKAAYSSEIKKLVSENPEYSSIKELKLEAHVLQLILDTWEEDDEQLSVEDACKEVEDYALGIGQKFSALPKLKPTDEPQAKKLPPPRTATVKTLTNDMNAIGDPMSGVKLHTLSDEQRYAVARARVLARRAQQGQG